MKAALHTKYGPPDELQGVQVDKPVPADNQRALSSARISLITPQMPVSQPWMPLMKRVPYTPMPPGCLSWLMN